MRRTASSLAVAALRRPQQLVPVAPLGCARAAVSCSLRAGAAAVLPRRGIASSAVRLADAPSTAAAAAAAPVVTPIPYAPSGPVSPVALSCIEFPYIKGDPASPAEAGRQYHTGTSARDAPVLVLHGLMGSAGNWRTMAPKLTQRRRLLSVDLRNHGASPHADDMRFAALAADIIALMDARGIQKAVLLGHSLGGKVAMATALLYPERIAALLPVDMSPVRYQMGQAGWRGVAHIVTALASAPLERFRSRAEVDKYLQPLITDFTTRAFVMQNAVVTSTIQPDGTSSQTVQWRSNVPLLHAALPGMAEFTLSPALADGAQPAPFTGPTLFVGGGNSPYLREAQRPEIERLFPRAELTWIPQAGHWVHVERPREFVDTVAPWLAKLEEREDVQ